jgi:hypothetical protein
MHKWQEGSDLLMTRSETLPGTERLRCAVTSDRNGCRVERAIWMAGLFQLDNWILNDSNMDSAVLPNGEAL